MLVVERAGGSVAGAAFLHYRHGSKHCRLYSLAVRAEDARRGLGTWLLKACENAARHRGCADIRLEVRADRQTAILFYKERGYCEGEIKLGFYEDGSDAVVMRKRL